MLLAALAGMVAIATAPRAADANVDVDAGPGEDLVIVTDLVKALLVGVSLDPALERGAAQVAQPQGETAMPGGRPHRLLVDVQDPPDLVPAEQAVVGWPVLDGPCSPRLEPSPGFDPTDRPDFVVLAFCRLLQRPVDRDGHRYWTEQMEAGMGPVELVQQLVASPEYQARGVASFRQALDLLTLTAELRAELEAFEAEQADLLRLRARDDLEAEVFDRLVDEAGLEQVDRVTPALVHGRRVEPGVRVNVALVHLSATRGVSVSPGDRARSVVGTWAEEIGAHVAINGNWYAPWDGPAVSTGQAYGGDDHFYTALFGFTADGDAIIEHHRAVNESVDPRITEGVSGHPTLVFRGEPTVDFGGDPTFTNRHPRTAIGLDASGDVLILVTVDGRRTTARGMTGAETVDLMVSLGAHDAVMLDGGGSTTMWLAGRGVVNTPSGGLRAVGNQLAVFGD